MIEINLAYKLQTGKSDGATFPIRYTIKDGVRIYKVIKCKNCLKTKFCKFKFQIFCDDCKKLKTNCKVCKKEINLIDNGGYKKVCSKKCTALDFHNSHSFEMLSARRKGKPATWQLGEKNHNWQGGKTKKTLLIRMSLPYQEWHKAVMKRDGYKCTKCGTWRPPLDADHIKPFSTHPELRFDVNNGRILCRGCHMKTPTYGVKLKNLNRQIIDEMFEAGSLN